MMFSACLIFYCMLYFTQKDRQTDSHKQTNRQRKIGTWSATSRALQGYDVYFSQMIVLKKVPNLVWSIISKDRKTNAADPSTMNALSGLNGLVKSLSLLMLQSLEYLQWRHLLVPHTFPFLFQRSYILFRLSRENVSIKCQHFFKINK